MKVTLQNARLSYPDLFVPRAPKTADGQGKAKYRAQFIIEDKTTAWAEINGKIVRGPAQEVMKQVISAVAQDKWGDKAATILKQLKSAADKLCFRDGDLKTNEAGEVLTGYAGHWYVVASNAARPTVLDRDGRSPLTAEDGRPYGGCYVNGKVDVYAFKHATGGNQIPATLTGVQFAADGEAFGGGTPASPEEFENLEEATVAATDDPLFD